MKLNLEISAVVPISQRKSVFTLFCYDCSRDDICYLQLIIVNFNFCWRVYGSERMNVISSVRKGRVRPDIQMTGKTVLITGANTGLGYASAIDLAKRNARVILACRDMDKGQRAMNEVKEMSNSTNVVLMQLDLSSMDSIRKFASNFLKNEQRLDVLMNNAGICMCPYMKSKEGFEMQFATNHLGHFLLTHLLLDILKRSAPSRVVTIASHSHLKKYGGKIYWKDMNLTESYTPMKGYCQSKLMNVLFSRELSKRLHGTGVTTYSVHPGAVKTDMQRHIGHMPNPNISDRLWGCLVGCIRPFWKDAETGMQTQIYCSVAPELDTESGRYYADCKPYPESSDGSNDEYAKQLWEISEKFTGLSDKL